MWLSHKQIRRSIICDVYLIHTILFSIPNVFHIQHHYTYIDCRLSKCYNSSNGILLNFTVLFFSDQDQDDCNLAMNCFTPQSFRQIVKWWHIGAKHSFIKVIKPNCISFNYHVTFPQTNTTINYLRCIFNTHHTIFYT
jgi:hypothetical protein